MKECLKIAVTACIVALGWIGSPAPASAQGQPAGQKPGSAPQDPKPADAKKAAAPDADSAFVRQAAMANLAEVELGRLAAQKAASGEVKQFAQRMVDDHSKALEELKGLVKDVTLPAEVDAKHRAMKDKLGKMEGAAFDAAYMGDMVTGHQQAVSLFQREAKSGKNPEIKAWAEKTLPTVQEHLKMAQEIRAKIGKGKPGNGS